MLVFALSAAILPAALLRAAGDLKVSPAMLTRVIATQFGAFFLSTLIGGLLSERYGKLGILRFGCLLTSAGALLWTVASGLPTAHVAAALLGMGGGILESLGSACLADLYPERRKFVLNVTQVAYCSGAATGPALMSVLLPHSVSWRLFFAGESLLGLLLLLLYGFVKVSEGTRSGVATTWSQMVRPLREPSLRLLALALFGYVLAESGLVVSTATYLQVRHQAPEQWALLAITLVWIGMLAGRIVCAGLPERFPTERLVIGLALAGALSLGAQALAPGWRFSLVLFAVSGFVFSGIWPLIVALCVTHHADRSGAAVGFVVAVGSLGVVVAPMAIATLIDGHASWLYPFFATGMLLTAFMVRVTAILVGTRAGMGARYDA